MIDPLIIDFFKKIIYCLICNIYILILELINIDEIEGGCGDE